MGLFWQVERGRSNRPRSILVKYFINNCVMALNLLVVPTETTNNQVLDSVHQRGLLCETCPCYFKAAIEASIKASA
jgi:hypothetical protein